MGKFSKIFHHIESKDLRNKYEQKKAAKIKEEKKKEDTEKYIASAMEQVKYNWRSKIDVGEAIREGMTTSDVATISSPANPDEVLNDTPLDNADDFAPGARGDDADFYPGNVGTSIKSGGSGSGNNGGFDIGNHLAFDGDGSTDGARWMITQPIDTTRLDHIVMSIITGNDSNGGETPDDSGEGLHLYYKTPQMDDFIPIDYFPTLTGSNYHGGDIGYPDTDKLLNNIHGPTFVDSTIIPVGGGEPTLQNYIKYIPSYARGEGTQFLLYQIASSGTGKDNYGVKNISYRRKTPIQVVAPLDTPEASSFIRGAEQSSTPKKRKKDVDDKLQASDEYTTAKFGNEFPGQEVRVGGEDPFASAKIGDDVSPTPQSKEGVKKAFSDFASKTTFNRGAPTAQPEAEPEPVAPSAQTTMAPTTDDGDPINVKTVGGKNSGVVQGADAAAVDTQEPEPEPEVTEPEVTEPEPIEPEPPDETKTPEEVEEIENEKYNAKADESANVIDNLIDFRLDQGLKSLNAIAQVTGVVINTAVNIGAFAANILGMKEANGFVSMIGKIQNSIDIARSVLSGKVTNANVLPQEIKSFTDSMKLDEFQAKKIFISDVRHEYADDNIYVKDGKIYQNGSGKPGEGGIYATPLANQGFEALDTHGSGYAQMIIPKDGSEPYLHYYDHNYENLNNASDVNPTGGIVQSIDEIWSSLFGPEDYIAPDGRVYKGLGKANPVDIVAAGFKSISHVIHQLKSGNTKFLPTRLKASMLTYFGSFDQVWEGLLNTSIEGFPPGIHGSALTDFKVPLSKLPQETQDMIAKHPLSWTPERIENMTIEQINEQLYPLLETDEQFQNYLDFTTDITKMSTEPVNTVPYAVAMQEIDEIYSEFEPFDAEFNELLELDYNESPFTRAERAAYEDMQTLTAQRDEDIKENQNKLGPSAQITVYDKLVKPLYDSVSSTLKSGGTVSKATMDKLSRQYDKYKKQTDKMDDDYYRIQGEILEKYYEQSDKISEYYNAQAVSRSIEGYEGYPVTVDEKGREDYTTLDGEVITSRFNQIKAHVDVANEVYDQIEALYEPVADLQKYVDGAFVKEGIGERFEDDFGFSSENWSPAKSGDGKPRGDSGKPKSDPDPRFAYAGTGADASTFAFDGGTSVAGNYPNASEQQILRNQLNAIKDPVKAKREQQRLLKMYGIYFPLASEGGGGGDVQVAHYQPKGDNILEKFARPIPEKKDLFERLKSKGFFNPDDIKPEFPENPPPQLDPKTGMHPQYGKKASRYKKLDSISANSMPLTGDPEIDAVVRKQKTINKIKKMAKNNLKESDFTNITIGNKVGQTFQHTSGSTITLDGALGGKMMVPSEVTIKVSEIPGEEFSIQVPGPTESDFALAGFTKPLDLKIQKRIADQSVSEINDRLDASLKASGAETAKVSDIPSETKFSDTKLEQKKEAVKNYKNELEDYDKKEIMRNRENQKRRKSNLSKVRSFVAKYGENLDDIKGVQTFVKIAEGGKKLIVINQDSIFRDLSDKFNVRVYKAEEGKVITKQTGNFGRVDSSIFDNPFTNRKSSGQATIMYDGVGGEVESKTFAIKEVPPTQKPEPPEHMKKNLSKGWQPVTKEDEDIINKLNIFFGKSKISSIIPIKTLADASGIMFASNLAIQLAKGDTTPITKSPGVGFDGNATRVIHSAIKVALEQNKTSYTNDEQSWYDPKTGMGQVMNNAYYASNPIDNITRAALGKFTFKVTPKGIQVIDDYDITKVTAIGGVSNPITDFISRAVSGIGRFTDQFGQSYDTQQLANLITGVAMRRGAELGYDMVDTDGQTIQPIYSGEDANADPTQLATPKGFNIPINYTMPTGITIKNLLNPRQYELNRKSKRPSVRIGKVDKGVYDLSNTYSSGASEAEVKAGYEKARKGIPTLPPFSELTSDIKPPDNIPEPNEPGWTYQEYMDMMNAIGDKAAAASLPITKEILEYGPGGSKTGQVPIGLIDAQEAITNARTKAEDALARAWERYNKVPEPSGYGTDPSRDTETEARPVRGGQGGRRLGSTTQRQGGAYNPRNPYGTGLDRSDVSFKKTEKQKKKKKNVRGSGARGGRKGRVNESNTFSKIKEFRNKY